MTAPAAAATGSARISGPEVTSWTTPLMSPPAMGQGPELEPEQHVRIHYATCRPQPVDGGYYIKS